jgi:hypothetical protein
MIQRLSRDHSHIIFNGYKPGKGRSYCPFILKFILAACILQCLALWTLRDRFVDGGYHHSTDYDRASLDSPPPRRSKLPSYIQRALAEPIRIANIAGHFYGEDALGVLEGCTFRDTDEPLK